MARSQFQLQANHVLLFPHIPKTGGTSLITWLSSIYGSEASYRHRARNPATNEYSRAVDSLSAEERERLRFVAGHKPYGFHRLFDLPFYYIALVRDPVRRLESDYRYNRSAAAAPRLRDVAERMTLDEYLDYKLAQEDSNLVRDGQTRFLTGKDSASLDMAIELIESEFLFVCDTVELDDGIGVLARFFGEHPPAGQFRVNVTRRSERDRETLSDAAVARCLESNQTDLQLLEYVHMRFADVRRVIGDQRQSRAEP